MNKEKLGIAMILRMNIVGIVIENFSNIDITSHGFDQKNKLEKQCINT